MRIKRMYEVRPVNDTHITVERRFNKKKNEFEDVERTVNGGFLVAFPQGHSTFFETEEQMAAAGITLDAALVDMDTGMRVSPDMAARFNMSLHDMIDSNVRMSGSGRRAHSVDLINRAIAEGE